MEKLSTYDSEQGHIGVRYVETLQVKEGVSCDVYEIEGDDSYDLARITITAGQKTPRQRVLGGLRTVERHHSGSAILTIQAEDGTVSVHTFPKEDDAMDVDVAAGNIMQWSAHGGEDVIFDEICYPPYRDGRYENLPE